MYRRYKLHGNRKLDTTEKRRKKLQKEYKGQPYVGGASVEFQNPERWSPQSKHT